MHKQRVLDVANETLHGIMDQPGGILYSNYASLTKGDVYFMGFNPGGIGGNTIRQSIDELPCKTSNAYLDEEWGGVESPCEKGHHIFQKRVCWLLEALSYDVRKVCASNLIFVRSREAIGVAYGLADTCWPVHEVILDIVKPKLILCCGNSGASPYGYLKDRFSAVEQCSPDGLTQHGNWKIKTFTVNNEGDHVLVVGLPHLSRYNPMDKHQVIDWIKQTLANTVNSVITS